ncbi:uncharacterized protein LOC131298583 [Rhododendron vialii]|uniref:uncharacterized protein LOC131298583 n=1 Tax=Rhododendron vialii TaxID=182163 RepID=UPI00265E72EF|nr:uncharacterized protein LOC131298583 [Rhododendron vialii]
MLKYLNRSQKINIARNLKLGTLQNKEREEEEEVHELTTRPPTTTSLTSTSGDHTTTRSTSGDQPVVKIHRRPSTNPPPKVMFPLPSLLSLMSPKSVPSTMPPRSPHEDDIDTNEEEEIWSGHNEDEEDVSSVSLFLGLWLRVGRFAIDLDVSFVIGLSHLASLHDKDGVQSVQLMRPKFSVWFAYRVVFADMAHGVHPNFMDNRISTKNTIAQRLVHLL